MINSDFKIFEDRFDAANKLVPLLNKYRNNPEAIVVAIPRGGLELGSVLAKELNLPLDVIFTKKIGFPGEPEYAIGAVGIEHTYINDQFKNIANTGFQNYITEEIIAIQDMLKQRALNYRGDRSPLDLKNKIVIVVDDGVATGSTLIATLMVIKNYNPKKIIVALPVASVEAFKKLQEYSDEVICLLVPEHFYGVGQFYKRFDQVDDTTAISLLNELKK